MKGLRIGLAVVAAVGQVATAAVAEYVAVTVTPTMEQRAANFDKSDVNKDGALSREEFATTPRALPPADAAEVFAVSDLNKDGKVTKAEFLDPNFGTQPKPAEAPKPKS